MHGASHRRSVGLGCEVACLSLLMFATSVVSAMHRQTSTQTTYSQTSNATWWCPVSGMSADWQVRRLEARQPMRWQLMRSTLFGATNVATCTAGMFPVTCRLQLQLLLREHRASARYSSRMPAMTSSCMLHSTAFACTSACSSLQRGNGSRGEPQHAWLSSATCWHVTAVAC